MASSEMETILVVCADPEKSAQILQRLHDGGANAIGPVDTAGLALTLAAQSGPRSAILAGETTGRRDAAALARELATVWGVDCYIVPAPDGPATDLGAGAVLEGDLANERRAPHLRALLGEDRLRAAASH